MAEQTNHAPAAAVRTPIRSALAAPDLTRLMVSSILSRLPFGAVTILLVLRCRDLGASYPTAGLVVGIYSIASGVSEPFVARLTDRAGQTFVLVLTTPITFAAFLAAALIPASWPVATLAFAGAAIGVSYAQAGGMLRALMIELLPEGDERHAAFALDSAAVDMQYALGPVLLVSVIAGTTGPAAGLAAGGVLSAAGSVWFALTPASRRWRPVEQVVGAVRERLATTEFALLCALMATMGLGFGALEVGTTAFADHHGHRSLAGLLFAFSAFGSIGGALVSARMGAPANRAARLTALVIFQAATGALLAAPQSLELMAVLVAINGLGIAPAISVVYGLAATAVPTSRVTEGYGWLGLAVSIGASTGAVVSGALTTSTSTATAFLVPGVIVGAGCLAAVRPLSRQLSPVLPTAP